MRLGEACDLYINARTGLVSPLTIIRYRESCSYLVSYLADPPLGTITIESLRAFRSDLFAKTHRYGGQRPEMPGGLSRHTIRGRLRVVRQLFGFLAEEGHVTTNPALRLELPSLGDEPPKAIGHEDIDRMVEAAYGNARDYALVLFFATTGCRVGGVVGLKLTDLDLPATSAIVREKGRGGAKTRTVFLTQETVRALKAWLVVREAEQFFVRHKTDRVFAGRRGALTSRGV